jgi:hypothetical protein
LFVGIHAPELFRTAVGAAIAPVDLAILVIDGVEVKNLSVVYTQLSSKNE